MPRHRHARENELPRVKSTAPRTGLAVVLPILLLLSACASTASRPSVDPDSRNAQTDDLAKVADDALQLAGVLGVESVLVVFDIDNTLLAMEQDLGSDQWYYWQRDLAAAEPCSDQLVGDRLLAQGALYHASAMRPTQPDAALQLRRLQQAGLTVIALTSRGPDYRLQTFRELRRNGMSFWPSALPPQAGFAEPFIPEGGSRLARYEDGVFLTAGQHKGVMLNALLDRTGTPLPAAIVMVDDKSANIDAILETYGGSEAVVRTWRYTREDGNVAAFDAEEAAAQWQALRPALMTIEELFGPDNFSLSPQVTGEDCGEP
jgi:hypothetical protein